MVCLYRVQFKTNSRKSKKEKEESDRKTIVEAKRKAVLEREKLNAEYKELVAQQAFETWMELKVYLLTKRKRTRSFRKFNTNRSS